jgi:hypothetical protein
MLVHLDEFVREFDALQAGKLLLQLGSDVFNYRNGLTTHYNALHFHTID